MQFVVLAAGAAAETTNRTTVMQFVVLELHLDDVRPGPRYVLAGG